MTRAEMLEEAYRRTEQKIALYQKLYPDEAKYREDYYFWLVFEDVLKEMKFEDFTIKQYNKNLNRHYFKRERVI